MNYLGCFMAAIKPNIELRAAVIAQPVHLLFYVFRQIPSLRICEWKNEEFTVTEPYELRLALRISTTRDVRVGIHRKLLYEF